MQDGEVLAALGEAGKEQEREEEGRVQGCVADDLKEDVGAEALAGEETRVQRHGDDVVVDEMNGEDAGKATTETRRSHATYSPLTYLRIPAASGPRPAEQMLPRLGHARRLKTNTRTSRYVVAAGRDAALVRQGRRE